MSATHLNLSPAAHDPLSSIDHESNTDTSSDSESTSVHINVRPPHIRVTSTFDSSNKVSRTNSRDFSSTRETTTSRPRQTDQPTLRDRARKTVGGWSTRAKVAFSIFGGGAGGATGGAIIGGLLGAIVGTCINPGAGTLVGAVLGAKCGAAIGTAAGIPLTSLFVTRSGYEAQAYASLRSHIASWGGATNEEQKGLLKKLTRWLKNQEGKSLWPHEIERKVASMKDELLKLRTEERMIELQQLTGMLSPEEQMSVIDSVNQVVSSRRDGKIPNPKRFSQFIGSSGVGLLTQHRINNSQELDGHNTIKRNHITTAVKGLIDYQTGFLKSIGCDTHFTADTTYIDDWIKQATDNHKELQPFKDAAAQKKHELTNEVATNEVTKQLENLKQEASTKFKQAMYMLLDSGQQSDDSKTTSLTYAKKFVAADLALRRYLMAKGVVERKEGVGADVVTAAREELIVEARQSYDDEHQSYSKSDDASTIGRWPRECDQLMADLDQFTSKGGLSYCAAEFRAMMTLVKESVAPGQGDQATPGSSIVPEDKTTAIDEAAKNRLKDLSSELGKLYLFWQVCQ